MVAGAGPTTQPNGVHTTAKSKELAISLPHSPGTTIHLHLTILEKAIILFLTTSDADGPQASTAMGSYVFAMPDRYNPSQPLSTPLYTLPSSLDLATRMAKLLARKTNKQCYVGSSINLSGAAGGGTVEEEMEAFRAIIDAVVAAT